MTAATWATIVLGFSRAGPTLFAITPIASQGTRVG
jgi:hypothetical protein